MQVRVASFVICLVSSHGELHVILSYKHHPYKHINKEHKFSSRWQTPSDRNDIVVECITTTAKVDAGQTCSRIGLNAKIEALRNSTENYSRQKTGNLNIISILI